METKSNKFENYAASTEPSGLLTMHLLGAFEDFFRKKQKIKLKKAKVGQARPKCSVAPTVALSNFVYFHYSLKNLQTCREALPIPGALKMTF